MYVTHNINYMCKLCNNSVSLEYKLKNCDHVFCFLCIKTYFLDGNIKCPECDMLIIENFYDIHSNNLWIEINKPYWLYSSAFNNVWWMYDDKSNIQLEAIFKDYEIRKKQQDGTEQELIVNIKPKKIKLDEMAGISDINDDTFAIINSGDASNLINFADEDNNDKKINEYLGPMVYNIDIGSYKYKIDFDNMKQINIYDSRKQRNIKRVFLEKIDDIKTYDIVGVAGIKF